MAKARSVARPRQRTLPPVRGRCPERGSSRRNGDVPGDRAPQEHQHGNVESHDEADADQRRREVHPRVGDGARTHVAGGLDGAGPQAQTGFGEFGKGAENGRDGEQSAP